jgi:hypothetical protein
VRLDKCEQDALAKVKALMHASATHKTRRAAAEVPRHLLGKAMKLDMEADDPSRDLPHLLPVLLWPKNSRTRKLPASKKMRGQRLSTPTI